MTPKKKEPSISDLQSDNQRILNELEERDAELAVINDVQEGLASGLDIDSIFELAGERIGEIFPGNGVALYTYDSATNWGEAKYILEKGERHYPPPIQPGPFLKRIMEDKKPIRVSTQAKLAAMGAKTVEGTSPTLSGLFIPLFVHDEIVGALNIESAEEEHAFTESDLRMVSNIASSLSIALENARLFNETEQRAQELAIINNVQTALAAKLDIQAIYDAVGDKIHEIFSETQVVDILTYDPATNLLHPRYVIEKGKRFDVEPWPLRGFRKHIIETGQPLVINENVEEKTAEYDNPSVIVGEPTKSWVGVPMIVGGEVKGVISLQHIDKENAFSDSDVRLLETLANSMSVALENARLFDETQHLLNETEERNAELAIINTVQRALAAELDIYGIYGAVGEKLREIFDSQIIAIYSDDLKERVSTNVYAYEKEQKFDPVSIPFSSLHDYLIELDDTYVFNGDFPDFAAQFKDYHVSVGELPKSVVGVPIGRKKDADTIITLTLQDVDGEKHFTDSDVRLLETLANSMGVALQNARLFDEVQKSNREITEALERQTATSDILHVMASSPTEIQPILDAVAENAARLFEAIDVQIYRVEGDLLRQVAQFGPSPALKNGETLPLVPGLITGRAVIERRIIHFNDLAEITESEYPESMKFQERFRPKGSVIVTPLVREDIAIGSVNVWRDQVGPFTEKHIELLSTFANQAAIAIENVRLFNETQRLLKETEQRAAELQIINSVQVGLASKLEMQAIYDLVGDKIREIFNADTTFVAFHDVENNLIVAPYYTDKGERSLGAGRPYGQGLAEVIIESGERLILSTSQEMIDAGAYNIASPGSDLDLNQSFLGVPIFRNGKTIGATSVQSYQPYAFDDNDLSLLQTLTNSMSVALENARLFDETQHLLKETEQRAAKLATINTVSQALVAESDFEALIKLIGEQVRQTFAADIVHVALLDRETERIHFPYCYGEDLDPLPLGEGLASKIIETGEPLLINQEMDRRRAEMGVTLVGVGARSFLGVPIQMGGRTFGVISAQSISEEGRFDQDDLHLLNTIAANVGTAIRNVQLFDEIKRQKQYYEAVIENSPAAITLLDMEATVTGWNPAAEKLFGYKESEALGRNIDDLVAKSDELHEEAVRYSKKAMKEKQLHLLINRTRKDGSLVEVEVSAVPVIVDGKNVAFISMYHDVTELQRARQAAEEANQAKSTFLANMSHELRTPLNAIIGFTRIVRRKGEDVLPGKQIQNLDKVLISADHLLNLINSVLDISKIEAGRMDVNPEIFELPRLIKLVVGISQPLLQEGVNLETDVQPDLLPLTSDQDMIKQILINLLSNAAKFTQMGKIVITARQDGSTQYVDVSDTGVGISEGDLERIFEEFRQAGASTTREYGGTGLGLSISRNLARLLGGDLTASSVEGEGSTFTLSIPVNFGDQLEGSKIISSESAQ